MPKKSKSRQPNQTPKSATQISNVWPSPPLLVVLLPPSKRSTPVLLPFGVIVPDPVPFPTNRSRHARGKPSPPRQISATPQPEEIERKSSLGFRVSIFESNEREREERSVPETDGGCVEDTCVMWTGIYATSLQMDRTLTGGPLKRTLSQQAACEIREKPSTPTLFIQESYSVKGSWLKFKCKNEFSFRLSIWVDLK
ncbi:PLC-like phosphodiesterases superfamily protein [Actinidia rufa]|uniref:PLC-like phosphodiesterases superfamily protein n=1 Tax=Actinidia rufa TaxID=165716 RepID=A0A7J0GA90_9ERIC|nr:PLC-like phosphodiesterases superfamily protein [Actinidia rufa]